MRPVPGHRALILLTLAVAAATYAIRLRYPLDTWVPVLDFLQVEPARVPQYATFFTLGVLAGRHGWLEHFPARTGWIWLAGGLGGSGLLFAVGSDAPCFGPGGATWPSALWALVDSALCVALCAGLLTLFRETLGGSGPLRRELAAGSYTVYIVHLPLVVVLQYTPAGRGLPALAAWGLVSVVAVVTVFPPAAGLRRLPGARRVL
ncbi:acyltransferase family protein [Actinoallomurus sp. NBC_01490]|uniref:acyltransferase family protein n=1 Tax=Actinoallomurus sp. NBC_01490 TaxID=2903557 RepID=UPI002E318D1A|nr:acyltransferase family protein [Actinoallomurus sp. NBC_01490]